MLNSLRRNVRLERKMGGEGEKSEKGDPETLAGRSTYVSSKVGLRLFRMTCVFFFVCDDLGRMKSFT